MNKIVRAVANAFGLLLLTHGAHAQDPFEIQVYDSETARPLEPGVELHANYFVEGTTKSGPGALLPTDKVVHLTLEPHLGLTDWAELGAYLQSALRPDGSYDYAGTKLRFKARLPHRLADDHIGLALNLELSAIPSAYSESRFGSELRPIADAYFGPMYFSINPIIGVDFEGDARGEPELEPAAKAEALLLERHLGFGTEYYSVLGPVNALLPVSEQVHRLFGVVDLAQIAAGPVVIGANLGVGYGLSAGEKWIVKSIIGIEPR